MKIPPVGAKLIHAGGWAGRQTDRQAYMTRLIAPFHSFANAPKTFLFYEPDKSHPQLYCLFQLFLHIENILHQSSSFLFENELFNHYRENLIQYHSNAMTKN